ncbi:unnamed protein product [Pedinophyceae sp. YPF-701]|nr:unnamed protein product [Pedinophyceae sp. YPF-701]
MNTVLARSAFTARAAAQARGVTALRPRAAPVAPRVSKARNVARRAGEESSVDVESIIADAKASWDKVEDKTTAIIYVVGGIVALWLASTVVGAVNSVPLLPKLMELIGLSYSAWFVYRYLLFKSSRQELVADIEDLKKKITGGN